MSIASLASQCQEFTPHINPHTYLSVEINNRCKVWAVYFFCVFEKIIYIICVKRAWANVAFVFATIFSLTDVRQRRCCGCCRGYQLSLGFHRSYVLVVLPQPRPTIIKAHSVFNNFFVVLYFTFSSDFSHLQQLYLHMCKFMHMPVLINVVRVAATSWRCGDCGTLKLFTHTQPHTQTKSEGNWKGEKKENMWIKLKIETEMMKSARQLHKWQR